MLAGLECYQWLSVDLELLTRRILLDNGSIPQLQEIHLQDRQVWHEIRDCQGHTAPGMVSR